MNRKSRFKKRVTWPMAVLALSCFIVSHAFAQSGTHGNWHMGRWMMDGWAMGSGGMLFMLLFWGVIIAGIVFLVRWLVQNTGSTSHCGASAGSQAMDVLKARYARGEITHDEFESIKKEILR